MQERIGLPGAGNVIRRAGAAGTVAGLSGGPAYGKIRGAENALDFLAVAFGAFELGGLLGAGKKDFETFIAFQAFEFINRHRSSPKTGLDGRFSQIVHRRQGSDPENGTLRKKSFRLGL